MRDTNFATACKYCNKKSVTGKVPTRLGLQEAKNEGEVIFYSFRHN